MAEENIAKLDYTEKLEQLVRDLTNYHSVYDRLKPKLRMYFLQICRKNINELIKYEETFK